MDIGLFSVPPGEAAQASTPAILVRLDFQSARSDTHDPLPSNSWTHGSLSLSDLFDLFLPFLLG